MSLNDRYSAPRQTILIYRLGSLGDTVVALPALRLVADAFPNARRAMLTNVSVSSKAAPIAEILAGTGLVDEYLEYPINLRSPVGLLRLRNRIAAFRPDVLVYLTAPRGPLRALRDAAFFYACGIKRLVGVPLASDRQVRIALGEGRYEYEGARLLRCISALGPSNLAAPDAFDLALSVEEGRTARAQLAGLGKAPVLALSIGAKADVKDWGRANWRALVSRLGVVLPEFGLVFLGAAIEREDSAALAALWPGPAVNLCGEVSVRESAAVLARAEVFIGHDSGPMHLAAAAGTRCVAIFSSQNLPGEWFPYGAKHKILYHEIECQGCRLLVCAARNKACILSITVDEVEHAVLSALKERLPRKPVLPVPG